MAQAATPPSEKEPARRPPRPRPLAVVAVAAAGLSALALLAWLGASTPAAKAYLRERLERALASRIPDALVAGDVRIDARFRAVFGPLAIPSSRPGAPPVVAVREVAVRPRWRALLLGRLEAASVTLTDVRVDAGSRGAELTRLVERLRRLGRTPASASGDASPGAVPPAVRFESLRVRAQLRPGLTVEAGPFSGRAIPRRTGAVTALDVRVDLPGGGRAEGSFAPGAPATVRLDGVRAELLPEAIRRRLPVAAEAGALAGELRLEGGRASFDLRVAGLTLRGARLAPGPVGPFDFTARGEARLEAGREGLAVERARVELGGDPRAGMDLELHLSLLPEPHASLKLVAAELDWAALLRALPGALAPGPDAPPVAGTFSLRFGIEGPLRRAGPWRLDGALDLGGLRRDGRRFRLDGAFTQPARPDLGVARAVVVGPQSPGFVAIASLPPHVVRAVTVSEDAGFFGHRGIDFPELAAALAEGRGRLRGASTISQQVAKNVFLSGERSYARKAREALLTVALEASLPKARILEVYLNVAEWGPGIVGLGEAARHYFGKSAPELSAREAAFLATIIPNPLRYHMYCARGALTPAWEARVNGLLVRLRELEVLTDDELAAALEEQLVFTHG